MRTLLSFFALGAVLLLAKGQWQRGEYEKPTLLVEVAADASPPAIAHAIERTALCEHAVALGAAQVDLVVQKELLSAVPPQFDGESAHARIERALLLGVHRAAPLVCERLAFQAQKTLGAEVAEPSAAMLERYLKDHASRYLEPARIDGIQIYVSSERHGERAKQVAAERSVQAQRLDDLAAALELTDPSLLPSRLASMTSAELDQRFGPGFGSQVFSLEPHVWSQPLPSLFGFHIVRLDAHKPEHVPEWSAVRERVRKDFLLDARAQSEREAVKALCDHYRIELRKVPS